jgi:hypothetical protein
MRGVVLTARCLGFEFRLKRSADAAASDELLDSECSLQKTAGRTACMVFGERLMRAKRRRSFTGDSKSGSDVRDRAVRKNRFYLTLTVIFSETSGGSNG